MNPKIDQTKFSEASDKLTREIIESFQDYTTYQIAVRLSALFKVFITVSVSINLPKTIETLEDVLLQLKKADE